MSEATIICEDCSQELAHALTAASQAAKAAGKPFYIFSQQGFLWLASHYPDVPRGDLVAKCYPGGRNELRRVLE